MAYVLNGYLTHIKIRELVIKKNFNSTEINWEIQSMNELETWHVESDSQSDITEVIEV